MGEAVMNVLRGIGSIFEIMPSGEPDRHPAGSGLDLRSDAEALQGDWVRVGEDLGRAMDDTEVETPEHVEAR